LRPRPKQLILAVTLPRIKSESAIRSEEISSSLLPVALKVARDCFPEAGDQQKIERVYNQILEGRLVYYSEGHGAENRLYPYLLHFDLLEPIGISGLYQLTSRPEMIELGWFGVRGEFRGRGFGRKIIEFEKARALSLGARHLGALVEVSSLKTIAVFYEKMGFKPAKDRIYHGQEMKLFTLGLAR